MTTADQARAAFLDALAAGESTGAAKAEGISPYYLLYGGGSFADMPRETNGFPIWDGRDHSHAAGRYQFEPATWREMAGKLHLVDFGPKSQDEAAWVLASDVYHRLLGRVLLNDLLDNDLGYVAPTLRSTWTSLSIDTFARRYYDALGSQLSAPAPAAPVDILSTWVAFGAATRALQTHLRDGGFDPGPVDGVYGPRTDAAVKAWRASL